MSRPAGTAPRVVVAGMGSEYRRDDGAGPAVAEEVTRLVIGVTNLGPLADPLDLLGLWDGAALAVVVDAVRSGAEPGTVRLIDLDDAPGDAAGAGPTSTHGISLAGTLRLARAVGNPPRRVVVVGVEGEDFSQGLGLSPAVERAVPGAARTVAELIGGQR
ncbi:MAG: hydrogenase maturation protease [Acidimicrobiales bacterium]